VKAKLVKVGERCITFWAYTNDVESFVDPKDPINLVFYNTGGAWNVQYDMMYRLTNKWSGAVGWDHYTYIDNTANGGTAYWQRNNYQLQYGSYWSTRHHIRIFNGGYDPHWADDWSIASVHYEYWNGQTHIVTSYEGSETFVKNDFADEGFVGEIWYANLYNSGIGDNNGYAPVIELLN
jgi:hypothetical protein